MPICIQYIILPDWKQQEVPQAGHLASSAGKKRADIIRPLSRCIQHILNKDAVACRGIIHQHMGYGADELTVLDDGTAAHADVK